MLEEGGGRMNTSKWRKEGEERFCVGESLIDTGSLTHIQRLEVKTVLVL